MNLAQMKTQIQAATGLGKRTDEELVKANKIVDKAAQDNVDDGEVRYYMMS